LAKAHHNRQGAKDDAAGDAVPKPKSKAAAEGAAATKKPAAAAAPPTVAEENTAALVEAVAAVRREKRVVRSRPESRQGAEIAHVDSFDPTTGDRVQKRRKKLEPKYYESELARLQVELVKLQEWIKARGLKVVCLFEGRDAAGKGGVIKRITETLNPRVCRICALGIPTERETTQWYFQRYVAQLPAAGEWVLLDRSWYNRAGVEHVMGFCTHEEYTDFLKTAPEFERMLIRSGIILIKYWFSVSDVEQERRFQDRMTQPTKRWKISPMDVTARSKWVEYSRAKDAMFAATDTREAPWWVVEADDKERARLNCINHLLQVIPYEDTTPDQVVLPPRQVDEGYIRPPIRSQHFVPEKY
jgi:polyphosphate kinase 2